MKTKKLTNHGAPWSKGDIKTLRAFSRAKVPMKTIVQEMRRTDGALRQMAFKEGIGLGHQR